MAIPFNYPFGQRILVRPAAGENQQDNRCYGDPFWWRDDDGPSRSAPREMPFIEHDPLHGGWWQGPNKLHNFKPNYYFTRPIDGKRKGTSGRLKDVFTRQGADVFITASGDGRTLMRDRPQKWDWSGWKMTPDEYIRTIQDKDFKLQDLMPAASARWTRAERAGDPFYNFKDRKFTHPNRKWRNPENVWTDVQWPQNARNSSTNPWSNRDLNGIWWDRVPMWAGLYPGGRPRR